jgi:uncharacterized protein (TIGR03437 family)
MAQPSTQLPFVITTRNMPVAQVGQPYSFQLESVGGTQPVVWTLNSVDYLKDPVRVSPDGVLSLTPSEALADNIYVTARDATGRTTRESLLFESASGGLRIVSSTVPFMVHDQPYNFQLQATGGVPPYQFEDVSPRLSLSAGSDPSPLASPLTSTLELTSSGLIRGTASRIFPMRRMSIRDSLGNAAMRYITFPNGPPVAGFSFPPVLPIARVGEPYRHRFAGTGTFGPWLFFANFVANILPPGMTLDATGVFAGTPVVRGVYSFVVEERSSFSPSRYNLVTFVVDGGPLSFLTTSLPTATLNQPYSQTIRASGGQEPIRFELASPPTSLPLGLSLSAVGVLSGTPTTPGTFRFSVRAIDLQNRTLLQDFTLSIPGPSLSLVSASLPEARVNSPYSFTLSATGGSPPYRFSLLSGNLPPGLSLLNSGAISGTPSSTGSFLFTVRLQDATTSADIPLAIAVAAARTAPNISVGPVNPTAVLYPLLRLAVAEGGVAPYNWELISGALPPGVSAQVSSTTLSLNGIPQAPGDYEVVYRLRDATALSSEARITLNIDRPVTLPPAVFGSHYEARLAAGTSFARPVQAPGLLPLGLSLASDGTISGTPRDSGHFLFGVTYRDSAAQLRNATFVLSVDRLSLPKIDSSLIPGGTVASPYRWSPQLITDSAAPPAVTWSIREGTLPAGLRFDTNTGEVSGTPTISGTAHLRIAASSDAGEFLHSLSLFIAPSGSPSLTALRNAASYADGGLAPGEILTAFGSRLGPSTLAIAAPAANRFPTSVAATSMRLDGALLPMLYTSDSQLSFVAPFNPPGNWVSVVVQSNDRVSAPTMVQVVPARPSLFTTDGSGSGPAAVLNQDGSLNTQANPAEPGSVIVAFFTGAGRMSPTPINGSIATAVSSLAIPLEASINAASAEVLYAGHSPSSIVGLAQANLRVPASTPSGAIALRLTQGQYSSPRNVTIWIR